MKQIFFPGLISVILLFLLAACQPKAQSATAPMLKPGDMLSGMALTTGGADVPPLWAFCSTHDSDHVKTSDCQIPPTISRVAIGHVFGIADESLIKSDWSKFKWGLSVDEQAIDLDAFGVYGYLLPTMPASRSPLREVFINVAAWDVVLMDLKPGAHTLRGTAQSEDEIYSWVVQIVIEASDISTR